MAFSSNQGLPRQKWSYFHPNYFDVKLQAKLQIALEYIGAYLFDVQLMKLILHLFQIPSDSFNSMSLLIIIFFIKTLFFIFTWWLSNKSFRIIIRLKLILMIRLFANEVVMDLHHQFVKNEFWFPWHQSWCLENQISIQ